MNKTIESSDREVIYKGCCLLKSLAQPVQRTMNLNHKTRKSRGQPLAIPTNTIKAKVWMFIHIDGCLLGRYFFAQWIRLKFCIEISFRPNIVNVLSYK